MAVQTLRQTMTDHVGVRRSEQGLKQALATIAQLEAENAADESFVNMCATATLIAAAALMRSESRGGHYRDDFPEADPALAHRTHITLTEALSLRDQIAGEATKEPA